MKKNKIISSLFWKFAERIGAQGVNFIVSIILARILAPEDYGLVALTTIFITISNVFIDKGFDTALIQKREADDLDFSSVFYCNIMISIIMYISIFLLAPVIAKFYNNLELILVLRVLGIAVLIAGVKSIQHVYVSKNMLFKKFFVSTLIGTIISAIVGIWMAYNGFGVWALVTQQLTNMIIDTIILWIIVKWRPIFKFSFERLKHLFKFGWRMLCSGLIDVFYTELYGLTIGKFYSTTQLAFYNKANQFPKLIMINVDGSISTVMLPALANEQDSTENIKRIAKKAIKASLFFLVPMMFGLAAISETLIKILLTDKWLPAVPLMQLLCLSYALWPIHTINLQVISALGRSDIFLKLEIIKKVIGLTFLIISIPLGMKTMVVMQVCVSIASAFINMYPNNKLIGYSIREQLKDILPYFIISLIMYIIVCSFNFIVVNSIIKIIIQILTGICIYLGFQVVLKKEELGYLVNGLKNRGEKK